MNAMLSWSKVVRFEVSAVLRAHVALILTDQHEPVARRTPVIQYSLNRGSKMLCQSVGRYCIGG